MRNARLLGVGGLLHGILHSIVDLPDLQAGRLQLFVAQPHQFRGLSIQHRRLTGIRLYAHAGLQARFSPALNRAAGELFARLTGGRYGKVTLTRQFEALAEEADGLLPRRALALSQGTADQLYLAVRLAVCRLCLPEQPPIFLDDALSAFDDARLALALKLLQQLGEEQQIFLFTCHRREQAALAQAPNVTLLTL